MRHEAFLDRYMNGDDAYDDIFPCYIPYYSDASDLSSQ